MEYVKDRDYEYIMNKYHDASKKESFNRFFANEKIFDASTGLSVKEIEHNIPIIEKMYENRPHSIIKARAFEYILDNTRIACDERDMFPAICAMNRILQTTLINKWNKEVFEYKIPETTKKKEELQSRGALSIYIDYDHSAPNWLRLFQKGFPMSYSELLINQVYRFFLAVGFGVLMGAVYELLSILKILLSEGRKTVVFTDIIFSVLFTVFSFFFMLVYNEGEARANLVVAQLAGVYVFHLTFGKRLIKPFIALKGKIKRKTAKKRTKRNKNLI